MVFNDSTGNLGICQEIDSLCDSNTTSYPLTAKARRVNLAIEELISKITQVCRPFPFDDENFANIASGTIPLEEGVSKYTITDKFLDILEMKVKDSSGYWHIVKPTTQREESEVMETLEAQTGLPTKFRAVGRTIRLSPAPIAAQVTLTAGLKFDYTRTGSLYVGDNTSGDNAKEPGIASPWHGAIAKMASLPYCKTYKKDRVNQLQFDINEEVAECIKFYANRLKSRINRLVPNIQNNR